MFPAVFSVSVLQAGRSGGEERWRRGSRLPTESRIKVAKKRNSKSVSKANKEPFIRELNKQIIEGEFHLNEQLMKGCFQAATRS